jgi:hypothetical protein
MRLMPPGSRLPQYEPHMPCVTLRGRCGQFMAFRTGHVSSPELHATVLSSAPRSRKTNEAYTDKCLITWVCSSPIMTALSSLSHHLSHASTTCADATRRALPELCMRCSAGAARAASAAATRSWPLDRPGTANGTEGLTNRHQAHNPARPYSPPNPSSSTNFRRNGLPTKTRSAILHSVK